jgi:pimeloyl-ACP methyl ester carboxylesterase
VRANNLLFGLLITFIAHAVLARPPEQRVQINSELAGAWLKPAQHWDGRAVVLLHGFADDMNGPGDVMKHLAEALADAGIANLRINFRGEGDRARTDIQSTLETRVRDTEAARDFVLEQPGVSVTRIGVMGSSLGAATAIVVGGRNPKAFRSMALWSSPGGDLEKFMLDTEAGRAALKDGSYTQDVPGWKRITTHRAYYESFRGVDLDRLLAKYPGAFLSVRGTQDYLPAHESEFLRVVPGRPAEALLIGGADHMLNGLESGSKETASAIAATVAWMNRTL